MVELYDGFAPLVYLWLEALGMCEAGTAWECLGEGLVSPVTGRPLQSGGGSTGWGRLHGIPQVLECYVQLARRAGRRQRADADTALASYAVPRDHPATVMLFSAGAAANTTATTKAATTPVRRPWRSIRPTNTG